LALVLIIGQMASSGADFWVTYWWITLTTSFLCLQYDIWIVQFRVYFSRKEFHGFVFQRATSVGLITKVFLWFISLCCINS
jgi:hypothetical protein